MSENKEKFFAIRTSTITMQLSKIAPAAAPEPEPAKKKMKTTTATTTTGPRRSHHRLSDDVLLIEVLTWLPAKSLCRFKSVSRLWCGTISGDPLFNLNQSRRQTPVSSGVIYHSRNFRGLFFPPILGESMGVPDARLAALGVSSFRLLASVHGLLLLSVGSPLNQSLYVCNPATQMGMHIPSVIYHSFVVVGLAFDPSVSPNRYQLIRAKPRRFVGAYVTYGFEIFSSSTGEWTASPAKMIQLGAGNEPEKVVFAGGVVYWHFSKTSVLSYDTREDEAQVMALPPPTSKAWEEEIGVWEERLTYTRVGDEGVQVWVLREEGEWEMKHRVNMEAVMRRSPDSFRCFLHMMSLRKKTSLWAKMQWPSWPKPMGYEGGKSVYLRVRKRLWKRNETQLTEVIVRCDLEAEEAKALVDIRMDWGDSVQPFTYHNSLVALPKPT